MSFDCIEQHIHDNVRENGEVQLTSAQDAMRARLSRYYCVDVNGDRYDTGVPSYEISGALRRALPTQRTISG
jgi:UTP-glucose-1-phosphate uridylyltransferase